MSYVTGSHAMKVGATTHVGDLQRLPATYDPPYSYVFRNQLPDLADAVRDAALQREPAEDEPGHLRARISGP